MLSRLNFNLFTTNLVVLGVWRSRTLWLSVTKTKCGRCARAASNCSSRCLFHSFRRRKHDWPSPFEMKKKKKKKNQRHGRGPSYSPWFLFRATTVHRSVYRMNIEATFIASVQNGVHTWLVLVSIRVICLLLQKNVKLASVWDASFNSVVDFFFCVCVCGPSPPFVGCGPSERALFGRCTFRFTYFLIVARRSIKVPPMRSEPMGSLFHALGAVGELNFCCCHGCFFFFIFGEIIFLATWTGRATPEGAGRVDSADAAARRGAVEHGQPTRQSVTRWVVVPFCFVIFKENIKKKNKRGQSSCVCGETEAESKGISSCRPHIDFMAHRCDVFTDLGVLIASRISFVWLFGLHWNWRLGYDKVRHQETGLWWWFYRLDRISID